MRSNMRSSRQLARRGTRRIYSDDEIMEEDIDVDMPVGDVDIDESASDMLFEVEDVAELVSEITGETVEVAAEEDGVVTFSVGEDEYTVEADGDEEIVESSTRARRRGARSIKASKRLATIRPATRRPVKASKKLPARRYTRRVSR